MKNKWKEIKLLLVMENHTRILSNIFFGRQKSGLTALCLRFYCQLSFDFLEFLGLFYETCINQVVRHF